jgi:1,4-alpha-glucan branching enzyme
MEKWLRKFLMIHLIVFSVWIVNECHRLGLRIMLDIVYLRFGSNAVFLDENPDLLKYNEDGRVIKTSWNWLALNYESYELRKNLWQTYILG